MDKDYAETAQQSVGSGASLGNRLSVSERVLSSEEREQISSLESQMIYHIQQANRCVLIAQAIRDNNMMEYMRLTRNNY